MQGINDQELQGDFDKYINQTLDRDTLEKKLKRFIINGAKGQQPNSNVVEPDSSFTNHVSNVNVDDNNTNTVNNVTDGFSVIIDEASAEAERNLEHNDNDSNNEEQITIRSVDRPDPMIATQL